MGKRGLCASCKPKVAYFEITVGIEEQIRGLEITVNDCIRSRRIHKGRLTLGRVESLQGTTRLVDEVLAMIVAEVLCADHTMEVRLQ